jgi:hypothetical protein
LTDILNTTLPALTILTGNLDTPWFQIDTVSSVTVHSKALQQLSPADTHIENMALPSVTRTISNRLRKRIIKALA